MSWVYGAKTSNARKHKSLGSDLPEALLELLQAQRHSEILHCAEQKKTTSQIEQEHVVIRRFWHDAKISCP